jgi:hypothetical protein
MTSSALPFTIPDSVRLAAQERGLGDPVDARSERSSGSMVVGGLVVFAVGLLLTFLIGAYNSAMDAAADASGGGTTQHFLAPTGAITLIGLGIAIRGLIVGTRTHYLYSGGLVHRRRSGTRAVLWPEVRALRAVYGTDTASVSGYRVEADHDRSAVIPLRLTDGRDAFVDRLLALARQHHISIT